MSFSKPWIFWGGISLLVLGGIFAAFGLWGSTHKRSAQQDVDAEAAELRAHGAIVENYSKVLGRTYKATPAERGLPFYWIAGGLVCAGGVMVVVAKRA